MQYYTMLYNTILYYIILYCIELPCITLHYTVLCHTALLFTTLDYTIRYYNKPRSLPAAARPGPASARPSRGFGGRMPRKVQGGLGAARLSAALQGAAPAEYIILFRQGGPLYRSPY